MNFTNYKQKVIDSLRWSQKYTETDMLYLAKGGFWWTAGRAGLFLISFLTMIAFAHWLPKEGYGTYQFVLAGLGFFTIFTLSGIDISLIKSTAQGKEGTLSLAVKEKIKFGTIGSLLSLILAGWYLYRETIY